MTNRKLHTRFRFVPKSMTLDDLERPFRTPFQNACVFGVRHKNLNEDRPVLSAAKNELQRRLSEGFLYRKSLAALLSIMEAQEPVG